MSYIKQEQKGKNLPMGLERILKMKMLLKFDHFLETNIFFLLSQESVSAMQCMKGGIFHFFVELMPCTRIIVNRMQHVTLDIDFG